MAKPKEESESSLSVSGNQEDSARRFETLFHQARVAIDRLNRLYQNYLSGLEKLPPHEQRSQLEKTMDQLQAMQRTGAQQQFRYSSLRSSYLTYRERWERMMKSLEQGKAKRPPS